MFKSYGGKRVSGWFGKGHFNLHSPVLVIYPVSWVQNRGEAALDDDEKMLMKMLRAENKGRPKTKKQTPMPLTN